MSHLDDYLLGSDVLGADTAAGDPHALDAGNKAVAAGKQLSKKLPKIGAKLVAQGQKLVGKSKADAKKALADKRSAEKNEAAKRAAASSVAPSRPDPRVAAKTSVAPTIAPTAARSSVTAPRVSASVAAATTAVPRVATSTAPIKGVRTAVRGLDPSLAAAVATLSESTTAMLAFVAMGWALDPVVDLVNQLDARGLKPFADQGFALLQQGDQIAVNFDLDSPSLGSLITQMQSVKSQADAWAATARETLAQPAGSVSPDATAAAVPSGDAGGGFGGGGSGGGDPFADEGGGGGLDGFDDGFDANAAMDAAEQGGAAAPFDEAYAAAMEQELQAAQAPAAEPDFAADFNGEPPTPSEPTEAQPVKYTSPFKKVSDEKWTEFVEAMRTSGLGDVSDSNALGAFELKPKRLADLGLMKNLKCVRSPDTNRMIWVGDFVSPLTAKKFLTNPDEQYKAFLSSMKDYKDQLKKGTIPKPAAGIVDGTTLSGVLAVLHRAGPKGLENFADPEKRFPETQELFEKVNGIF